MADRHLLLELLGAALRRIEGRRCVANYLAANPSRVDGPLAVAAVGKAASSMALGVLERHAAQVRRMLVITKDGHVDPELVRVAKAEILESSHPVPDARSRAAGARLVDWLDAVPADELPLLLVSGGASSLVEHLRPGVDLAALIEVTRTGLAAGWSIERLNSERTRLSAIKGGGLSRRLVHRAALALFISDVPGDDTRVIGGGLLGPSAGGEADQVDRAIVASLGDATNAVAEAGAAHGLQVETSPHRFDGEAEHVAREFVVALRASPADVLVWGGESVVRLPPQPGRGGRNQHLALAAAFALKNFPRAMVLAVGTDGTDGVTPDAGALVDSNTVERIELAGFDAQKALDSADSGTALEAAGDLIHTGPTGSNVCDLLVGMR